MTALHENTITPTPASIIDEKYSVKYKETNSSGNFNDLPKDGFGNLWDPYFILNRSRYHQRSSTIEDHGFCITDDAQYTLGLSGTDYVNDDWYEPAGSDHGSAGVVIRPQGSPRNTWFDTSSYRSSSGTIEVDGSSATRPRIVINPYEGGHDDASPPNMWVDALEVYVTFMDKVGDPGRGPSDEHGWDLDGDEDEDYWIEDPVTEVKYRDPDDLVPTIVFKKVDP